MKLLPLVSSLLAICALRAEAATLTFTQTFKANQNIEYAAKNFTEFLLTATDPRNGETISLRINAMGSFAQASGSLPVISKAEESIKFEANPFGKSAGVQSNLSAIKVDMFAFTVSGDATVGKGHYLWGDSGFEQTGEDFTTAKGGMTLSTARDLQAGLGGVRLVYDSGGPIRVEDFTLRFTYEGAAVPESSSVALLGVAGLGICLRRKRRA